MQRVLAVEGEDRRRENSAEDLDRLRCGFIASDRGMHRFGDRKIAKVLFLHDGKAPERVEKVEAALELLKTRSDALGIDLKLEPSKVAPLLAQRLDGPSPADLFAFDEREHGAVMGAIACLDRSRTVDPGATYATTGYAALAHEKARTPDGRASGAVTAERYRSFILLHEYAHTFNMRWDAGMPPATRRLAQEIHSDHKALRDFETVFGADVTRDMRAFVLGKRAIAATHVPLSIAAGMLTGHDLRTKTGLVQATNLPVAFLRQRSELDMSDAFAAARKTVGVLEEFGREMFHVAKARHPKALVRMARSFNPNRAIMSRPADDPERLAAERDRLHFTALVCSDIARELGRVGRDDAMLLLARQTRNAIIRSFPSVRDVAVVEKQSPPVTRRRSRVSEDIPFD